MNNNNVLLNLGGKNIRLIGTAHVSQESIDEVTNAIRNENPGIICVELDKGRYDAITQKDIHR